MSGTQHGLDAASSERKARLAKLASLKRKQPGAEPVGQQQDDNADKEAPSKTDNYLSGRNYDTTNKAPKLGFDRVQEDEQETVEKQAEKLSLQVAEQAAQDEKEAEAGIDLFKLQPKKPNWDLKRDLAEKTRILDIRTQNAIARLVRERIENAKKEALKKGRQPGEEGEEVGLEGNALVEGVHQREREEQEQDRREREAEEEGIP